MRVVVADVVARSWIRRRAGTLSDADLSGAKVVLVDLRNVNLTGANLAGARVFLVNV